MEIFVKIFLPKSLYEFKQTSNLYGEFSKTGINSFKFFVLETDEKYNKCLDLLGDVCAVGANNGNLTCIPKNVIRFVYDCSRDSNFNFLLLEIVQIEGNNICGENLKVQLILYDKRGFEYLSENGDNNDGVSDEFSILRRLIKEKNEYFCNKTPIQDKFLGIFLLFCEPILKLIGIAAKDSEVYNHSVDWINFLKDGRLLQKKLFTILFDVLAGVVILLLFWFYVNPADYLMKCTLYIVDHLRLLLDGLKGNPAGLKLNSQLNQFLRECFKYHIDLWAAFLRKAINIQLFSYILILNYIFLQKLYHRQSVTCLYHSVFWVSLDYHFSWQCFPIF